MGTLTLQLTLDEVNFILASMGKMPYDQAAPVVKKVTEQATTQLKEAAQTEQR